MGDWNFDRSMGLRWSLPIMGRDYCSSVAQVMDSTYLY